MRQTRASVSKAGGRARWRALLLPVAIVEDDVRVHRLRVVDQTIKVLLVDSEMRYEWKECQQSLWNVNGRLEPVAPGKIIEYRVPD